MGKHLKPDKAESRKFLSIARDCQRETDGGGETIEAFWLWKIIADTFRSIRADYRVVLLLFVEGEEKQRIGEMPENYRHVRLDTISLPHYFLLRKRVKRIPIFLLGIACTIYSRKGLILLSAPSLGRILWQEFCTVFVCVGAFECTRTCPSFYARNGLTLRRIWKYVRQNYMPTHTGEKPQFWRIKELQW